MSAEPTPKESPKTNTASNRPPTKDKLTNVRNLFKSRQNIIRILSVIVIVISVLYILSSMHGNNTNKPTVLPTPAPSTTPTPIPVTENKTYYLNSIITTFNNVNGYSWSGINRIFYSTPNGIFQAKDNKALVNSSISYITWSNNGKAIYSDKQSWYYEDANALTTKRLNTIFNRPILSSNGNFAVNVSGDELQVFETSLEKLNSQKIPNIKEFYISQDSKRIGILNDANELTIYDSSLNKITSTTLDKNSKFVSLSYDGNYFLTLNSNILVVSDTQNNQIANLDVDKGSQVHATWLDNFHFILTESKTDRINRVSNYIYKVSLPKTKEFLISDQPIIGKINTSIALKVNMDKNTLLLAENKGKLWILSLIPNQLPTYSNGNLIFTPVPETNYSYDQGI